MRSVRFQFAPVLAILPLMTGGTATAADAPSGAIDSKRFEQTVSKAIQFVARTQGEDGSWNKPVGPAVTALITTGVLRAGRSVDDPLVAKALKNIESYVQPDGGIYAPQSTHQNYETSVAIVCLAAANKDGRYDKTIKNADKYVKVQQWDEGEGRDAASFNYGGAGYGRSGDRPDLSNTSFLMDSLQAAGASSNDPAVKKALIFVSRCQNLESEHNTSEFAAKNPDGGFYYTIAAGGSSVAGKTDEGGLRSYGSMTYAGLKSMLYAGLTQDDPRVKAAAQWIKQNYTVAENPGLKDAGLYYYYHTFSKALDATNQEQLDDANGKPHYWRAELFEELARRQRADGSWSNENAKWMEGDPNLSTAYVLLALSYCRPAK